MFFFGVCTVFVAALALLSLVFLVPELSGRQAVLVQEVFQAPDVKIPFDLLDSAQVRSLEPFLADLQEGQSANKNNNPFEP